MMTSSRPSLRVALLAVWALAAYCAYGVWDQPGRAAEPPGEQPTIDVLFSPDGGCTDRIVEEIDGADKRVLIQIYFFTSKPIADAIVEAKKRGVKCEVLADASQEKMTYGRLPVLRRAGVKVLFDDEHKTANNKIILIDHHTVITGSFNFTKAAEEKNAENVLILKHHSAVFEKYLDNYKRHKAHSRPYKSS